jgi:hypothetical protein
MITSPISLHNFINCVSFAWGAPCPYFVIFHSGISRDDDSFIITQLEKESQDARTLKNKSVFYCNSIFIILAPYNNYSVSEFSRVSIPLSYSVLNAQYYSPPQHKIRGSSAMLPCSSRAHKCSYSFRQKKRNISCRGSISNGNTFRTFSSSE